MKTKNAFAYFELGVAEKGLNNIVAAKSAFKKASKEDDTEDQEEEN